MTGDAIQVRLDAGVAPFVQDVSTHVYPEESCGLLLGTRRAGGQIVVKQAISTANVAALAERRHRYAIEPRLMLEWERIAEASGLSIVGFFHSHPDHAPKPSATDGALAWPTYVYLIVGIVGRDRDRPLASGMAAWTFDEPSSSFRELPIEIDVGVDQIEYFI